MAEFNWTVDDIERAQRDFSYNFMRLDCIRTESYNVAIDCMTECIEKSVDVQPICHGRWVNEYLEEDDVWWADCTNCKNDTHSKFGRVSSYAFCPNCGAKMDLKEGDVE